MGSWDGWTGNPAKGKACAGEAMKLPWWPVKPGKLRALVPRKSSSNMPLAEPAVEADGRKDNILQKSAATLLLQVLKWSCKNFFAFLCTKYPSRQISLSLFVFCAATVFDFTSFVLFASEKSQGPLAGRLVMKMIILTRWVVSLVDPSLTYTNGWLVQVLTSVEAFKSVLKVTYGSEKGGIKNNTCLHKLTWATPHLAWLNRLRPSPY